MLVLWINSLIYFSFIRYSFFIHRILTFLQIYLIDFEYYFRWSVFLSTFQCRLLFRLYLLILYEFSGHICMRFVDSFEVPGEIGVIKSYS